MLDLNIDARLKSEQVLDMKKSLEVSEIVIKAVQMLSPMINQSEKRKSKPNKMDENDIRFIVEEGRRNKNQLWIIKRKRTYQASGK